ncbi:hypothetical protein IV203_035238 [Nitzschia inconspicua]|uniref:Uncharacterized protein n=1 Tax=Nitzschia inconspicua TaxID=303405 RepID=A0A9K3LD37_9STRA|nr:hypothetical protein IV203_035238 [Nitzschia inconspicua]
MKSLTSFFAVAVLVTPTFVVQGRQWHTIIDHTIYRKSNIDKRRFELTIEQNPFFFPGDSSVEEESPTVSPGINAWVTLSPTLAPSSVPSDVPSFTPTEWSIELNGGCRQGHELFEVHMYDSWGDGWDNTMLTISGIEDQDPTIVLPSNFMTRTTTSRNGDAMIKISRTINLDDQSIFNPEKANDIDPLGVVFQGTLQRGSHEVTEVCFLPRRCYQVTVAGGEFLNEVSWDIRPGNLDDSEQLFEPILGGGAPAGCKFSLPDENGHHFCPNTCSDTLLPSTMMTQSPKLLQNLQQNHAYGSDAINKVTGETVSTTLGTTRSSYGQGGVAGGIRTGSTASSVLRKFRSPEENNSN